MKNFEQIIHNQVKRNYPFHWDENYITLHILKSFSKYFSQIELQNYHEESVFIKWHCFEAKGLSDNFFSSIALIVKINNRNRDILEGVTFIDTKKRLDQSIKFDELKLPQLGKLMSHAPHSSTILYDYDKISDFHTLRINLYYKHYPFYQLTPYTYAVIIPNNIVLNLKKKDTSLYNFSFPLPYQFCLRYFRGFDLDFSKKNLDLAKGFIPETKSRFLMTIHLGFGFPTEFEKNDFNTNEFRELVPE
jgi:hypothetical protein